MGEWHHQTTIQELEGQNSTIQAAWRELSNRVNKLELKLEELNKKLEEKEATKSR